MITQIMKYSKLVRRLQVIYRRNLAIKHDRMKMQERMQEIKKSNLKNIKKARRATRTKRNIHRP